MKTMLNFAWGEYISASQNEDKNFNQATCDNGTKKQQRGIVGGGLSNTNTEHTMGVTHEEKLICNHCQGNVSLDCGR